MASLATFLQTVQTTVEAESTLSFFGGRVLCTQGGFFDASDRKNRPPILVISPRFTNPRASGKRLLNARDDIVTLTFFAYQSEFGTEAGLFGDGTRLKGILEIGNDLEVYLKGNQFSGATVPEWISTEYPLYYERVFEHLSEVRITMEYGLRGAYS